MVLIYPATLVTFQSGSTELTLRVPWPVTTYAPKQGLTWASRFFWMEHTICSGQIRSKSQVLGLRYIISFGLQNSSLKWHKRTSNCEVQQQLVDHLRICQMNFHRMARFASFTQTPATLWWCLSFQTVADRGGPAQCIARAGRRVYVNETHSARRSACLSYPLTRHNLTRLWIKGHFKACQTFMSSVQDFFPFFLFFRVFALILSDQSILRRNAGRPLLRKGVVLD